MGLVDACRSVRLSGWPTREVEVQRRLHHHGWLGDLLLVDLYDEDLQLGVVTLELFDNDWITAAREIANGYRYPTVPEFVCVLRVSLTDGDGDVDFTVADGQLLVEPAGNNAPDIAIHASRGAVIDGVIMGRPQQLVEDFESGAAEIVGDFSKLRVFADGLFQGYDPDRSASLAALAS